MTDQGYDQENSVKEQATETFAKKVEAIQKRARQEGFVSDGQDDKPMMDEAWGEDGGNAELQE